MEGYFTFQWEGGCFSDGGPSFLSVCVGGGGGVSHGRALVLIGEGLKKIVG